MFMNSSNNNEINLDQSISNLAADSHPPKTSPIPEDVSKRITALRFFLILLVVFAHNNKTLLYILTEPEHVFFSGQTFSHILQIINYVVLAQASVPLFFIFSGYLSGIKTDSFITILKKKSKGLLIPYLLWPAITIGLIILAKVAAIMIFPDKVSNDIPFISDWTLEDWVSGFFGHYSAHYNNVLLSPWIGPFYYIRDLFILSLLTPVIKKILDRAAIPFFIFSFILYVHCPNFIITWSGLVFYSIGLFFAQKKFNFFEPADKVKWIYLLPVTAIVLYISYTKTGGKTLLSAICGIIICLKLSKTIADRWFQQSKTLAGFSFFLYAIHEPKFQNAFIKIWYKIFPQSNWYLDLLENLVVSSITVVLVLLLAVMLKKICPKFFYLLNGGR